MATIMGLLNQIANEEVVLPAIQRDFVWSEGQTQTLLDSIMRGYPIGIALLWETYNDIQYRSSNAISAMARCTPIATTLERRRLRVVLDGQQRLQSLYIALHGQLDGRQRTSTSSAASVGTTLSTSDISSNSSPPRMPRAERERRRRRSGLRTTPTPVVSPCASSLPCQPRAPGPFEGSRYTARPHRR